MTNRGWSRRFRASHRQARIEIVEANPLATLKEIQAELAQRTGVQAHNRTLAAARCD